jgi:hypothetical protein
MNRSYQTACSMRQGRLAKAMWLAALVPLFLAAVLPDQIRTLVCRFSGAVMDEGCCPPGADEAVETEASLKDQPCCSIRTIGLARSVSDRRVESAAPRPYPLFAWASNIGDRQGLVTPAGLVLIRYGAPHVGPPIFLLKRAILI